MAQAPLLEWLRAEGSRPEPGKAVRCLQTVWDATPLRTAAALAATHDNRGG